MAYKMTPKRRAALRKAQLVSARKRRGKGKGKLAKANRSSTRNRRIAVVAATGGLALAAAGVAGAMYARKTASGGPRSKTVAKPMRSNVSRRVIASTRNVMTQKMMRNSRLGTPVGRPGRQVVKYSGTNKRSRLRNTGRRNARRVTMNNLFPDRSFDIYSMSLGQTRRNLANPNFIWEL